MSRKSWPRMIIATAITALLGGTYLIVENNRTAAGAPQTAPVGFLH